MTNHPRYSPPPQQPGYSTAPNQPVPPAYAHGQQHPYNQQFDWRYRQSQPTQTPYRQPYEPYEPFKGTGAGPIPGGTGPGRIPVGAGVGPMAGRAWRIGCMGHTARRRNVVLLLAALAEVLGR